MPTADGILVNAAQMLPALSALVYMLAILSGIVMFGWGIFTLKTAHESGQHRGTHRQAAYIILSAVMLINASLAIGIWSETLLGGPQEPAINILSYDTGSSSVSALSTKTFAAIIAFVQFVGLLAFVRGWYILPRVGERQDATLGKALTHIVGGVLALNVVAVAKITAWTFGLAVLAGALDTL